MILAQETCRGSRYIFLLRLALKRSFVEFPRMNFDLTQHIILEDERARLEPLSVEHIPHYLEISRKHPDLLKYSPTLLGSDEAVHQYVAGALAEKARGVRYPFAIYDKQAQAYVGSSSYGSISNPHDRIEIGWTWISREYQRTGLNQHNKFLMLQYAFETLKCERMQLKTDSRNEQSRTAILRIGAKFEGILRNDTVMYDGYRRSTAYYSILAEEWPEVKEQVFGNL
ncbi:MAG TPA: N-acetyltransferase [Cytophagales bacterium]|nr:N-acetyltransferase [Cytophagales bacterium]HAA17912.1 N-acetyltransferase [Cytophagales bacterium]HAP65282.1 N-acetyltransferase [Cytophagales bacterium]